MPAIDPSQDIRGFRDALGQFATGVTIVTATVDGSPVGITANSFASVSLDPALVLWSPAKSSRRHDIFCAAQAFAIHVLSQDQAPLAGAFVKDAQAFDGTPTLTKEGAPIIDGALARFECTRHEIVDAGDHTIILGQVQRCITAQGAPLVFVQGAYSAG